MAPNTDPVALTAELVRCASVTPADAGALGILETLLSGAGFACTRVDRGGVGNLFARWGEKGHARTLGFNGHTDVVPPGDVGAWSVDPFAGEIRDGQLWGRGAADMKSGVAAFAAAAVDYVSNAGPDGSIVLAITGDEEGDATDGTVALLDWMDAQGEAMSHCLVGEPTCPEVMGQMMKIGRRGSMTVTFEVTGSQGHTAYPHRSTNAAHAVAALCHRLATHVLDEGTAHFDPSTLAISTIDVGNPGSNVIPGVARATANIRFNDTHSGASLTEWLENVARGLAAETGAEIGMTTRVSGESFLTPPGDFSDLIAAAIKSETGRQPELSTSGGTSDARFVKNHCPVVEFGLVGQTMHQVDERVATDDIHALKAVYSRIISDYFS